MILKPGDKLLCINNDDCRWWTIGDTYKVLKDDYGLYIEIDNTYGWYLSGIDYSEWLRNRFKLGEA